MKTTPIRQLQVLLVLLLVQILPAAAQNLPDALNMVANVVEQRNEIAPVLPSSTSSAWYSQAIAQLTEREYYFRPFGKTGKFSAANHAQHIGFLFHATGYTVKNIKEGKPGEKDWTVDFTLLHIGRQHCKPSPLIVKDKNFTDKTLAYHFNNFSIEYLNDEKGMRQNFVVGKKPDGTGKLQIAIALKGNLSPAMGPNNELLLASAADKKIELTYDKLKVWDANGQLLLATMELTAGNQLVIAVDDKAAVYPITVDPLNHTPNWTASGNGLLFSLLNDLTLPVLYGFSVSNAGDVNGDGYGDIVIGTPLYVQINSITGNSFNPISVGAAFVYMGTPAGPTAAPSEVLQPSTVAGALLGFNVSTAGDVDGDGKSDIVVGAPGDNINLTVLLGSVAVASGKVYLYKGSSFDGNINTSSLAAGSLSLKQADYGLLALLPLNPLYGFSISNAGDVNGDGYDDVVVGSPAYIDLLSLTVGGRVDVYNGGPGGLSSTPSATIKGGLLNGLFGFTVSSAGKVNNDAYSDIIVGAPASISILGVGSAFIFHGSAAGITQTLASAANTVLNAPGLLNRTLFGFSVSGAGDVNGDGRDDVIIGEPLNLETTLSLQLVAVGKAHIFYGSNTGIKTTGSTQLSSPRSPSVLGLVQGNLLFGFSVSGAGDMNCDGLADVVIGEPGGTAITLGTGFLGLVSVNALSGSAYIFSGQTGAGPVNTPAMVIQETGAISAANLIGYSVSNAGDVNGDGHPDVIIGAPNGTLSLSSSLTGLLGNALGYLTTNSIGSAYVFNGCFFALLPIHLVSFDAHSVNGDGVAQWTVTGTDEKATYEIEKSLDSRSFNTIGTVTGKPANGGTAKYTFTDHSMTAKKNYYRLKLINADGKVTYSKVVLLSGDQGLQQKLKVSPNPARDAVQLRFNNMAPGKYTVTMVNVGGQVILQENITLGAASEIKTIARTPAMLAGTYFIRLTNESAKTMSTSSIVLQ